MEMCGAEKRRGHGRSGKSMNIAEFYQSLGVNVNDVLNRLRNEGLIKKYLLKFAEDSSFSDLEKAISEKNYQNAFRAAHTIKGICLNLELRSLSGPSVELTELLRSGAPQEVILVNAFREFAAVYRDVVEKLAELK